MNERIPTMGVKQNKYWAYLYESHPVNNERVAQIRFIQSIVEYFQDVKLVPLYWYLIKYSRIFCKNDPQNDSKSARVLHRRRACAEIRLILVEGDEDSEIHGRMLINSV